MDTRINGKVRTTLCTIASATEIEVGDLVTMTTGLIVKAGATSTKLARAMEASAVGDIVIEVSLGMIDIILDCEDAFAVTQKGGEYDMAIDGVTGKQTINQSGTTYQVLLIDPSQDAGVVDATTDIKAKIIRPLDQMLGTAP